MRPYFKYLPIAVFTLAQLAVACSNNENEENIVELTNTDGFTTSNTDITLPETSFGNETECKQSEDDDFNAEFLALVFQMFAIILLGVLLGRYLDQTFMPEDSKAWMTILFSLVALSIALYLMIRKSKPKPK